MKHENLLIHPVASKQNKNFCCSLVSGMINDLAPWVNLCFFSNNKLNLPCHSPWPDAGYCLRSHSSQYISGRRQQSRPCVWCSPGPGRWASRASCWQWLVSWIHPCRPARSWGSDPSLTRTSGWCWEEWQFDYLVTCLGSQRWIMKKNIILKMSLSAKESLLTSYGGLRPVRGGS